jgi:dienelactone hydrolase
VVTMSPRRTTLGLAAASLLAAAAGCGGSGSHPAPTTGPFTYDPSQALAFVDRGRVNHNYPISIQDVSFNSGKDRVSGYLIQPPKTGKRRPAVIYLHGAGGDRTQLLVPATWLAGRGAVALTITAPSSAIPPSEGGTAVMQLRRDVALEERNVVAVRRAIELLRRRKDVDPNRIGLVGWSAGARTGAIVAGVEPSLRSVVLMSGGAAPLKVYVTRAPKELQSSIRTELGAIDPLRYIKRAKASTLLLQDGRDDQEVPRAALVAVTQAAPAGTTVRWYNAGHALNTKANRDQLAWLTHTLGLTGPPVKGALTGPS